MKIVVLSNNKDLAGPVRAKMYAEQYQTVCTELCKRGYQENHLPSSREFHAQDPLVSAEYDSIQNITALADSLQHFGHQVQIIDISDGVQALDELNASAAEYVFNYAEGLSILPWGWREVEWVKILEILTLPHSGSPSHIALQVFDKQKCADTLRALGFKAPKTISMYAVNHYEGSFPVFVKPRYEGSGIGIDKSSVVQNLEELKKVVVAKVGENLQPVVVQEMIQGVESTVALLPYNGKVYAFPPLLVTSTSPYGYDEKFGDEALEVRYTLMEKGPLMDALLQTSLEVYTSLGIQGFTRIDFISNKTGNYVLELNQPAGLGSGGIDIFAEDYSIQDILANVNMSDFPKAVLAAVHSHDYKELQLPPITSFASLINMIAEHSNGKKKL